MILRCTTFSNEPKTLQSDKTQGTIMLVTMAARVMRTPRVKGNMRYEMARTPASLYTSQGFGRQTIVAVEGSYILGTGVEEHLRLRNCDWDWMSHERYLSRARIRPALICMIQFIADMPPFYTRPRSYLHRVPYFMPKREEKFAKQSDTTGLTTEYVSLFDGEY